MPKLTKYLLSAITIAIGLSLIQPAMALEATNVGSLNENNTRSVLLKHKGKLIALAADENNDVDVYISDKKGENWKSVTSGAASFSDTGDTPADVTSLGPIYIYRGRIHLVVNQDGGSQVWALRKRGKNAEWKPVGEAGLSVNTEKVYAFVKDGNPKKRKKSGVMFAFVQNGEEVSLVKKQGNSWSEVDDFSVDFQDVTAVTRKFVSGKHYLYVGDSTGMVYRALMSDLTNWEGVSDSNALLDDMDEITALRSYKRDLYVSGIQDGAAIVLYSEDGEAFTEVGDNDLLADAEEVNKLMRFSPRGPLFAAVSDSVNGSSLLKLDHEAQTWETVLAAGYGDTTANEAMGYAVPFKGNRYIATTNETDGAQIYRLDK